MTPPRKEAQAPLDEPKTPAEEMYLALLQISLTDYAVTGLLGAVTRMHETADAALRRVNMHYPDLAASALGVPLTGRDE